MQPHHWIFSCKQHWLCECNVFTSTSCSQLTTSPTVKEIGYKYRCCDSLGNTNLCYNGSGFTKLQLFGNGLDQYKYSVRLAKLFTRSAKKGKKQLWTGAFIRIYLIRRFCRVYLKQEILHNYFWREKHLSFLKI